jgi:hypothetical protein
VHQDQQQRRQYFTPDSDKRGGPSGKATQKDEDARQDAAPKPMVMLNQQEVKS